MASPRKVVTKLKEISQQNASLLQIPSTVRDSQKLSASSILNIDTPNRSRIANKDFLDKKLKILGVGGFATVYRATYKGVNVAAKVLKQNKYSKELIKAEMHRVNIAHKNVVQILGYHQDLALSIIMLELCGPSLEDLIEERPLSKKERISFLTDIALALTHCHNANIIHADIKPKNILISDQNKAKLGDFGSSIIYNKSSESKVSIKATASYEAPEVIRGESPTPASDVYSFGVVAWQMLSRVKPFAGYHSHVIIYLTGKGHKPEKEEPLDDEFEGEYKNLYRKMWSTNFEDRPHLNNVLHKLSEFQF